jgi:hypothetical protein
MNQLTNQERAKVFAMYWGGKAGFLNGMGNQNALSLFDCSFIAAGQIEGQLLLTPLSEINDDKIILARIVYKGIPETGGYSLQDAAWWFLESLQGRQIRERRYCNIRASFANEGIQYLINRGYDVPLFFDVDHWANGKTAIELGVAISKNK